MWLTSNKPARVRTASCSARMPEYSSGMSQPPKFTIFAPETAMNGIQSCFAQFSGRRCRHRGISHMKDEKTNVACVFRSVKKPSPNAIVSGSANMHGITRKHPVSFPAIAHGNLLVARSRLS